MCTPENSAHIASVSTHHARVELARDVAHINADILFVVLITFWGRVFWGCCGGHLHLFRYHYNDPNNTNYYTSTVVNQGVDPKVGADVFSGRSWGGSVAAEGLASGADATGTATSTSLRSISRVVVSSLPPHTARVPVYHALLGVHVSVLIAAWNPMP